MKMNRSEKYGVGSMRIIFMLFFVLTPYSLLLTPTLAQTEYTLLQPIPLGGAGSGDSPTANASTYIKGIFMLTIAIATGLAVLAIIFGGIKYMSTDTFTGKNEAKATIEHALWGLLLAIGAWLILYTVNPKLVEFDLSIAAQPVTITPPPIIGGGGMPMTPAQIAADTAIRNSLPAGVTVSAGPCLNGQTTGCVNLNGILPSVISGLTSLSTACSCTVMITGGTEGGHSSHSGGNAVDIRANPAIKTAVAGSVTLQACNVYMGRGNLRAGYLWEPAGSLCGKYPSTADHWHVQF